MLQLLGPGATAGDLSIPLSVRPAKSSPFDMTVYCYSTVNGDTFELQVSGVCKADLWSFKQTITCNVPTVDGSQYEGSYQLVDECERIRIRMNDSATGVGFAGVVPET